MPRSSTSILLMLVGTTAGAAAYTAYDDHRSSSTVTSRGSYPGSSGYRTSHWYDGWWFGTNRYHGGSHYSNSYTSHSSGSSSSSSHSSTSRGGFGSSGHSASS